MYSSSDSLQLTLSASARDIMQAVIEVMVEGYLRPFGMPEDELITETLAQLDANHLAATAGRVQTVIDDSLNKAKGSLVRLLVSDGPIALRRNIEAYCQVYENSSQPLRIDQLLQRLYDQDPDTDKLDYVRDIAIMTDLGYLTTDSKLYLNLIPRLIYSRGLGYSGYHRFVNGYDQVTADRAYNILASISDEAAMRIFGFSPEQHPKYLVSGHSGGL